MHMISGPSYYSNTSTQDIIGIQIFSQSVLHLFVNYISSCSFQSSTWNSYFVKNCRPALASVFTNKYNIIVFLCCIGTLSLFNGEKLLASRLTTNRITLQLVRNLDRTNRQICCINSSVRIKYCDCCILRNVMLTYLSHPQQLFSYCSLPSMWPPVYLQLN